MEVEKVSKVRRGADLLSVVGCVRFGKGRVGALSRIVSERSQSRWSGIERGLRQGCPLPPTFLTGMCREWRRN